MDNTNSEAKAVAQLTTLATAPTDVGGKLAVPVARMLDGEVVSLEGYLPRPTRIRERATLKSVDSFVDYINLHKNDRSIIFADRDTNTFTGIVDYHDGQPNNRDHRGTLKLEHTTGMEAWLRNHNKPMSQEQFGLFLEENAGDIVDPAAATMIQIATQMRAIKNAEFESKVALDNGAYTFAYKEEVRGTYQDGHMEVPKEFSLALTPYRGMADAYKVTAKLRYRVDTRGVALWYAIPDLERLLEKAFDEVKGTLAEKTALKVLDGGIHA